MLKLMVVELGSVGRWFRSGRQQLSPSYMVKTAVPKAV
jgi:hypothetical protein